MVRFAVILSIVFLSSCLAKSRDEIMDYKGVSPNEGIAYLDKIEKSGANSNVYFKRASLYYQLEDYQKALLDVKKSLEIDETNADYIYLSGRIYQKIGQPDKAIENLLLAEGLGLHNHLLYQTLAEEYLKIGKSEDAKLAIERLIGLNKNSANHALAGRISLNLGDTTLAERYFRQSIALNDNAASQTALSDIYFHKGQFDESGHFINKALVLRPTNLPTLNRKAIILRSLNELDSAKYIYRQMIKQDSLSTDYLLELGSLYFQLYKYDSAGLMAEKVLNIKAENTEGRLLLARVQDKKSNFQQAMEIYNEVLEQDSTNNLARAELENLQRKVAYLRRLDERQKALDSARNNAPPLIIKKGIDN